MQDIELKSQYVTLGVETTLALHDGMGYAACELGDRGLESGCGVSSERRASASGAYNLPKDKQT